MKKTLHPAVPDVLFVLLICQLFLKSSDIPLQVALDMRSDIGYRHTLHQAATRIRSNYLDLPRVPSFGQDRICGMSMVD